jgi:hypothetical protein
VFDPVVNRQGQPIPELPPDRIYFRLEEVACLLGKDHAWVKDQCLLGAITWVRHHGLVRVERYEVLRLLQVFGDIANAFYTPRQVADFFMMSETFVRKQCRLGNIQFDTDGPKGSMRIPASEVARLTAMWAAPISARQPNVYMSSAHKARRRNPCATRTKTNWKVGS